MPPKTGEFSFTFPTRDPSGIPLMEGTVTLEVSAQDWNGNETTVRLTLIRGITGDVPGFTVVPGNKSALISWDEVPGAESYDLFEYEFGPWSASGVTSPYTADGLINGELYRFEVRANIPAEVGQDAWSGTIKKKPLSVRTLAPWVKETGYGSITIEWQPNQHANRYLVERANAPDGPWDVSRVVTGNMLKDTRVEHDTRYYYRVTPTEFPDITSEHISAVPGRFGHTPVYRSTLGSTKDVTIAGQYAYIAAGSGGLAVIDISDPQNPGEPVYFATDDNARDVVIIGNRAYVAAGLAGLAIINIADPENPGGPVYLEADSEAHGVAVLGNFVYLACHDDGDSRLAVIDITDPRGPPEQVSHKTNGKATKVTMHGDCAYVAADVSGLAIIEVSHPNEPGNYSYGGESGHKA